MFLRRAFYFWQFIAALFLPAWVLIGRGLFGSSVGWDFLLYVVLCPILGVAMLVVALITVARKEVRTTKSVSWLDVAILAVWHLAVIGFGFVDSSPIAAIIVLATLVGFWSAVWQLFTETRSRVKNAFALPEYTVDAGYYDASAPDAGEVIVIEPDSYSDRRGSDRRGSDRRGSDRGR